MTLFGLVSFAIGIAFLTATVIDIRRTCAEWRRQRENLEYRKRERERLDA